MRYILFTWHRRQEDRMGGESFFGLYDTWEEAIVAHHQRYKDGKVKISEYYYEEVPDANILDLASQKVICEFCSDSKKWTPTDHFLMQSNVKNPGADTNIDNAPRKRAKSDETRTQNDYLAFDSSTLLT